MESRQQSIGHIAAMFTVSVWGATFVSTKVLLRHFTPEEILFLRFLMGMIALWAIKPKPMKLKKKSDLLYFAGAGLTGLVLYYFCENVALGYGDASIIGVIVCTAPIFSGILSNIFLKEKLKAGFFIGFLVSMIGLIILSFSAQMGGTKIQGIILAFIGAIAWGFYSVITRKVAILGYDTFGTTQYTFLFAVIMMIPIAVSSKFSIDKVFSMDLVTLGNLLFLGLCASAICFVIWNFAVKTLGVVRSSVYIYASPVITVILAAIFLDERMGVKEIIGTILVLSGLLLSEGKILGGKGRKNE